MSVRKWDALREFALSRSTMSRVTDMAATAKN